MSDPATDAATPPPSPTYVLDDGVAVITLDDGKANAVSHAVIDGLDAALDRAESEARAVVIAGREGKFSAGFDLATMTASDEAMRGLVADGARLLARIYGLGLPTVAACTGHALAAGALMLLTCDTRIGAEGAAKIGLNEVAIGMALPIFAVELARDRLAQAHVVEATIQGQIYTPADAVAVGYLDRLAAPQYTVTAAVTEARRLGELRTGAYARTKQAARQPTIERILATLDEDLAGISGPSV